MNKFVSCDVHFYRSRCKVRINNKMCGTIVQFKLQLHYTPFLTASHMQRILWLESLFDAHLHCLNGRTTTVWYISIMQQSLIDGDKYYENKEQHFYSRDCDDTSPLIFCFIICYLSCDGHKRKCELNCKQQRRTENHFALYDSLLTIHK